MMRHRAGLLRAVGARTWRLEHPRLLWAAVQRVMGGAILAIAGELHVRVVDGAGAGIFREFAMLGTEGPCRVLAVLAARVVALVTDQCGQGVDAGSRTVVHARDGGAGDSGLERHPGLGRGNTAL